MRGHEIEGEVILGGEVTDDGEVADGDLVALIIREGGPNRVSLYANDAGAGSCTELLDSVPDDDADDFIDVEDGDDIETA